MKATIKIEKEVELKWVRIVLPIREYNEDIPVDFPLRVGDTWEATVDLDTHTIRDWPIGKFGTLFEKVRDGGSYYLLNEAGETELAIEQGYVPNDLIPGEYGDYIDLQINVNGVITNWEDHVSIDQFYDED